MDAAAFYNNWLLPEQNHTDEYRSPPPQTQQQQPQTQATANMDDIMADIAGPSTSPATTTATQPFFLPHYAQPNFYAYPYSATWQTPSHVPLSNYSTLNGATTSTQPQSPSQASPRQTPMAIDPALTNLNGSSQSSPPRPFYQPQTTSFILSQFYQQAQQQAQQQQQQQQQQQGTLSPQALHPSSFYASPPASREPTPQERKAKLFKELVPLLDSKAFTGAQAVQNLVQVIQEYGAQDVGVETRQTILSKMRDHAPNHYFRAWTENPAAMDMLRDWLKAGVAGKNDGDTIMPLLHIIDRLPLTLEALRVAKLGKLVLKLVKEPPTPAIKDMASKVERKWRRLLESASTEAEDSEESKAKKRKEAPAKSSSVPPPAKRPAVGTVTSTKPSTTTTGVKKVVKTVVQAKDAKSDSSFFSAPKPKPKLPSFKKGPPPAAAPVKKESDTNVAQPSSIDPFQEALRSMGKIRKESPAAVATPPPASASSSATPPASLSKSGKKKKTVSWAPPDRLEEVKLIEKAIYDDDPIDGVHLAHNLRDLDRGEGAALHAHLFEETLDWSEPILVEIPSDIDLRDRGENSTEKVTQEKREQTALSALYISAAHIPESPGEASYTLLEGEVDKDVQHMIVGPEVDSIFWNDPLPPAPPPPAALHALPNAMTTTTAAAAGGPAVPSISSVSVSVSDLIAQLGNTESSAAMATLQTLPPEQIQNLLQEVSAITRGAVPVPLGSQPFGVVGGGSEIWPPHQNAGFQQYDYTGYHDDNNVDRAAWGGRGRGGGGGSGGARGRQYRRKPCSFFQAGRCKYGDQCDFAHEIV